MVVFAMVHQHHHIIQKPRMLLPTYITNVNLDTVSLQYSKKNSKAMLI